MALQMKSYGMWSCDTPLMPEIIMESLNMLHSGIPRRSVGDLLKCAVVHTRGVRNSSKLAALSSFVQMLHYGFVCSRFHALILDPFVGLRNPDLGLANNYHLGHV